MQTAFQSGHYDDGALAAIDAITALLQRHFPATGNNPDELPNEPIRL